MSSVRKAVCLVFEMAICEEQIAHEYKNSSFVLFSEMVLPILLSICSNIKTSSVGSRFPLHKFINVLFQCIIDRRTRHIKSNVWPVLPLKSFPDPVPFKLFHTTQYDILPSLILYSDIVLLSSSKDHCQNDTLPLCSWIKML